MAFGVGISVMKLNDRGRSSKASMPIVKACREAGPERESRTQALDRTRSNLNEYVMPDGVTSGQDLADWFEDQKYARMREIDEQVAWELEHGKKPRRRMREDALPAVTFTLQFEQRETDKWSQAKKRQAVRDAIDAWSAWAGCTPDAYCVHYDEGTLGVHVFTRPLVRGEYNGKRFTSPERLRELHTTFVNEMRAKGYDVAEHLNKAERARRGLPKKPAGMSANDYADYVETLEKVETARAELRDVRAEASQTRRKAESDAKRITEKARYDAREEAEALKIEAKRGAKNDAKQLVEQAKRDASATREAADNYAKDVHDNADAYARRQRKVAKEAVEKAVQASKAPTRKEVFDLMGVGMTNFMRKMLEMMADDADELGLTLKSGKAVSDVFRHASSLIRDINNGKNDACLRWKVNTDAHLADVMTEHVAQNQQFNAMMIYDAAMTPEALQCDNPDDFIL